MRKYQGVALLRLTLHSLRSPMRRVEAPLLARALQILEAILSPVTGSG
jgi:hypothetical protein